MIDNFAPWQRPAEIAFRTVPSNSLPQTATLPRASHLRATDTRVVTYDTHHFSPVITGKRYVDWDATRIATGSAADRNERSGQRLRECHQDGWPVQQSTSTVPLQLLRVPVSPAITHVRRENRRGQVEAIIFAGRFHFRQQSRQHG